MTGPEHYREAEKKLKEQSRCRVTDADGQPCPICAATLARAQVHATLALAAATALVAGDDGRTGLSDYDAWSETASTAAASKGARS